MLSKPFRFKLQADRSEYESRLGELERKMEVFHRSIARRMSPSIRQHSGGGAATPSSASTEVDDTSATAKQRSASHSAIDQLRSTAPISAAAAAKLALPESVAIDVDTDSPLVDQLLAPFWDEQKGMRSSQVM